MIFSKKDKTQDLAPVRETSHEVAAKTGTGKESLPRNPADLRRAPAPARQEMSSDAETDDPILNPPLDESQSVNNIAHDEKMLRHSIGLASDRSKKAS